LRNLTANGVDGPYAIVTGTAVVQSAGGPARPVFFVSSVIPHIDQISSGVLFTSTAVAAIDMQPPWGLLFTMRAGSRFVGGGFGVGPMVFDSVRRQLYLGGCYFRSAAFGAGEPGSALCNGVTTNLLRILNVDVQDAADPVLFDLRTDVLSIDTVQFLLGDPDPGTGAPTALWATMRNPDTLVRIELPAQPSIAPRVRKVIPCRRHPPTWCASRGPGVGSDRRGDGEDERSRHRRHRYGRDRQPGRPPGQLAVHDQGGLLPARDHGLCVPGGQRLRRVPRRADRGPEEPALASQAPLPDREMSMKQALLSALLAMAACNTTTTATAIGEFTSPTGMAATGAGDRDVLFIANTGRDSLRALQLCTAPLRRMAGSPHDLSPECKWPVRSGTIRVFPAPSRPGATRSGWRA